MKTITTLIALLFASPALAQDWRGAYIGINGGYSSASVSSSGYSSDLKGGFIGGQLGYNIQYQSTVFGLEADLQKSALSATETVGAISLDHQLPWFGTVRGRLGYATSSTLFYVTGGAALIGYEATLRMPSGSRGDGLTRPGWAAGAGIEYAITRNWSAKIEYLHLDIGTQPATLFATQINVHADENLVRVGLNYRF